MTPNQLKFLQAIDHDAEYLTEESIRKLLPEYLQRASKTHFTTLHIASMATEWLTEDGHKNILDIGAGIGKFCIAGAMESKSMFTGIEYRESLVKIAQELISHFGLKNVVVKQGNIIHFDFSPYNAFYLYNSFYENIQVNKRLNDEMPLSDALHKTYQEYTRKQLDLCKPGTRLVTFHGDNDEVPDSFAKVKESKDKYLKLWIRR
jgi:hypothetical protein